VTTEEKPTPETATLLITCPDRPGLVAAVSNFLFEAGANIVHADQHIDREGGLFLQRVQFEPAGPVESIEAGFAAVAEPLGMRWSLRRSADAARVAVLASSLPHCLGDLLARWEIGELPGAPAVVISNHPDHADLAAHHGVPYHHLPVTADTRDAQERAMVDILDAASVDLVVLARYMQVLSSTVLDRYPNRIINIHHSFLPAFSGGRPYHQAYARGVKVIGATAHYVTAELDEGPIIEQDVARVSHRDEVVDLARKGRDLEKVVLARAVRAHLEHRVLVYRNRTVVFG
jgi:formyltetrahydrofolate deformylase